MGVTPNALTPGAIGDLVQTTLRFLNKPNFTEIATPLQKHTAMKHLLRKKSIELASGYGIQWDVMVAESGAAAFVGLGASDNVNDVDVMTQATADWRNATTNYAIIGQVLSMNMEPARIVDYVRVKRVAAMLSLVELMENMFWGPPVASTDNLTPWGVNTWIVKNATQGFNGGAPSGFTTIGLNPTTYPNWNNYTDIYTAVSQDDLVRRLRKAATFTDWEPPVDGMPLISTEQDYGAYTNYGVIGPMEEILMSQNDNLGPDIASQDGKVTFRRTPMNWVPKLEADTTNPVYLIPWGDFRVYILKGWWLKETHIENYPGQHTISAHFMDATLQPVMVNRRTAAVVATAATYPS